MPKKKSYAGALTGNIGGTTKKEDINNIAQKMDAQNTVSLTQANKRDIESELKQTKEEFEKFVEKVIERNIELKQLNQNIYPKVALMYDKNNPTAYGIATPGYMRDNEFLLEEDEKVYAEKLRAKKFGRYVRNDKYHDYLMSEEYITSLPDDFFTKRGTTKKKVNEELKKLVADIEKTKESAKLEGSIKNNRYSYQDWAVENCAEVWAARKAIINGAKYDDLAFACVHTPYSKGLKLKYAKPCENCKRTFEKLDDVGKGWYSYARRN